VLQLDMARTDCRCTSLVVIKASKEVVRIGFQPLDSLVPPGVDPPARREERHAGVGELAVREVRPEVTGRAVALADENLQPAL